MQRVPDKSSRPGDTQAKTEEKREVIGRLRDVLRSCCALLEKTSQIPINGDVNLLQCILKCAPVQQLSESEVWLNCQGAD